MRALFRLGVALLVGLSACVDFSPEVGRETDHPAICSDAGSKSDAAKTKQAAAPLDAAACIPY